MSTPHDDEPDSNSHSPGIDSVLEALARAPRPQLEDFAGVQLPEGLSPVLDAGRASAGPRVPAVGDVVDGRYRIDGLLGTGGMGVVFAAVHLATGRRVALKWLQLGAHYRTEAEREAAVDRFMREAQAAGRIRHANVVDVHDAGTAREAPFLVMELLEGETLRVCIDRAALSWEGALALLLPVMEGVEEAHRRGVVHRDLKPDNVFLARQTDGSLCPKVLDFGISRLRGGDANELSHPSLTRTGAVIGTPAYMPLEQLRAAGEVDARTDVYALGVVLYEMLSQKRPYVARNAADFAALMTSELPTPLSKHRADLRGARERAVMKALSRDPEQRYASVGAFALALKACGTRARSRYGGMAAWCGAAALALLAVSVGVGLFSQEPSVVAPAAPSASRETRPAALPERATASAANSVEPTSGVLVPAAPVATAPVPSEPHPVPGRERALVRPARRPTAPSATEPAPVAAPAKLPPTALRAGDFVSRDVGLPTIPAAPAKPKPPSTELGREQF